MRFREYNAETDRAAVHRIWHEVGWMEAGKEEVVDTFFTGGRTWVAEIEGQAECQVQTAAAVFRYLEEDLPACVCTAVTTSHVARKRGAPKRLLAKLLSLEAAEGALLSQLGIFDQGFYNQLGYGTGSYEIRFDLDPASLNVPGRHRIPRRFTADDSAALHTARLARLRRHGGCNVLAPEHTQVDARFGKNTFGLGYCDTADGTPSHYLWLEADNMSDGPYRVKWSVFRTAEQFRELLSVLRGFEDQVRLVSLREPPGLQLQDLIVRPFRYRSVTRRGAFANEAYAAGYWQVRLLDLAGGLARTHLACAPVRFNLALHDPIAKLLEDDAPWRGIGGEYVVDVGQESRATAGTEPSLPTLTASVNAFSRLWFGVQPASGLAFTDDLAGPPELLAKLDQAFRLPVPKPDWDF